MQKVTFNYHETQLELQSDPSDYISSCIDSTKTFYEIRMLEAVAANFPQGTVLDVGANIGNHTLYLAKFTSARVIHAFEPMPKSFYHLKSNVLLNRCDNVVLHNFALSDKAGSARMEFPDPINQGMAKISNRGTEVQLLKLDDLNFEEVSLIKIDVEGHEMNVLRGGFETLQRCRPHVYVEIQDENSLAMVEKFMRELGYFRGQVYNATPTYAFHPAPLMDGQSDSETLNALENYRTEFDSNIENLNKQWKQRYRHLELERNRMISEKNKLQSRLDRVLGSVSWRITAPIRRLLNFLKI